jgi:hypothetical protein
MPSRPEAILRAAMSAKGVERFSINHIHGDETLDFEYEKGSILGGARPCLDHRVFAQTVRSALFFGRGAGRRM